MKDAIISTILGDHKDEIKKCVGNITVINLLRV